MPPPCLRSRVCHLPSPVFFCLAPVSISTVPVPLFPTCGPPRVFLPDSVFAPVFVRRSILSSRYGSRARPDVRLPLVFTHAPASSCPHHVSAPVFAARLRPYFRLAPASIPAVPVPLFPTCDSTAIPRRFRPRLSSRFCFRPRFRPPFYLVVVPIRFPRRTLPLGKRREICYNGVWHRALKTGQPIPVHALPQKRVNTVRSRRNRAPRG